MLLINLNICLPSDIDSVESVCILPATACVPVFNILLSERGESLLTRNVGSFLLIPILKYNIVSVIKAALHTPLEVLGVLHHHSSFDAWNHALY